MVRFKSQACFTVAAALILTFPLVVSAANDAQSIRVAVNGKANVSIVVAAGSPAPYSATELRKYLGALSGTDLEIITDAQISSRPAGESLILLGNPKTNKAVRDVAGAAFSGLKPDGFVLQSGHFSGRPALVVGGNDDNGTMYGVYDLVERLGVTFLLNASDHADLIPAVNPNLAIPALKIRKEPAFSRRGYLLPIVFDNMTAFSYNDYEKLIDQMAKLKCNYLQIWWFAYQPWLKFSYNGETKWMGDVSTKESGYLAWALGGFGSRTSDDITIGKELFKNYREAPPEMQHVETPDQAYDVAQDMMHRMVHHAKLRGIKVWLAIETGSLAPNLARHAEVIGPLPFHYIFGTFTHPLDHVNRDIQTAQLKALIATYPEAEGYYLTFSELYPQLESPKYRAFFEERRPEFFDIRRLRWPWTTDIASDTNEVVDSTIALLDLFQYLLKQRDQFAPDAKVGVMGLGRGYALPVYDRMLPKDIPFTDLESGGVWTPSGVPMEDFGGMGNRERTVEPRMDCDSNMMGMQFSVKLYSERDHILTDGAKYGVAGFAGQIDRSRGMEANSRFLADGGWDAQLTANQFYDRYSKHLFGEAAAPDMYKAFMTLEENERRLGYYNFGSSTMNCCGPLPETEQAYRYYKQPTAFYGPRGWGKFITDSAEVISRFEGAVKLLDSALSSMKTADPKTAAQGKYELGYMMNRTESYRDYIQSLIAMRHAYVTFYDAFANKDHISQEDFAARLDKSMAQFDEGNRLAQTATRKYAELVDETSDLGVLYHLNTRAVMGFDLARQWMGNVVNFQEGKPYTNTIAWDRLYKGGNIELAGGNE